VNNSSFEPQPIAESGERLDSWKEIAAYLKRSVRTVQRWEAEEGMPIRRHLHEKRGTVYAHKSDLDIWWTERGAVLAEQNGSQAEEPPVGEPPVVAALPETATAPRRESRRALWVSAGFATAVLAGSVLAWLSRNGTWENGSPVPLPFKARDWVLVAGFENRTGEELFDGALDYALARELSNSRYVNVVPRQRVADALRLMRKAPDSPVDAGLAREICLRDGGIRALLTGRVEKLGANYLVSVEVVEPEQGTTVAAFRDESVGRDASVAALRRISDRVRESLGETLPAREIDAPLAKVTTSNLRALQLYSQADVLMAADLGSQAAAEELLRRAVAEDPSFASAYIHVAHAIHNQGRPPQDYLPYAETAFRLADTTTDRERYFIRGSYYHLLGERQKAITAYEALIALYPDHTWALGNLFNLYVYPEDLQRQIQIDLRLADLRPGDFDANYDAGFDLVVWKRDPVRAAPYLRRAQELATPEVVEDHQWQVSWLELLPFAEDWFGGDLPAAVLRLDAIAAKIGSLQGRTRTMFAVKTALCYLTLGRIQAAEQTAARISDPLDRNDTLMQVALFKGDERALRAHLQVRGDRRVGRLSPGWWETTAILQARAGLAQEAGRFLEAARARNAEEEKRTLLPRDPPQLHTVPGEMALADGDLVTALRELERAMQLAEVWYSYRPGFFLSAESLAAGLKEQGELARAIEVLERVSEKSFDAVMSNAAGVYWLRSRFELSRLYREAGRVTDARVVEAELRKLLALADKGHPILRELQKAASS
jgi:tetratricopeptide (TPR) repeat protein